MGFADVHNGKAAFFPQQVYPLAWRLGRGE
jgi:hypothetical protein